MLSQLAARSPVSATSLSSQDRYTAEVTPKHSATHAAHTTPREVNR